jgi:tetratricopeptide (TPR) repeat protein
MKSNERHELEQNALADWIEKTGQSLSRYWKHILVALATVIVIALVGRYLNVSAQLKARDAWQEFFAASKPEHFELVAERYPGTAAASFARLRAADEMLQEARDNLVSDRSDALLKLDKVADLYEKLMVDTALPDQIRRQAAQGRAVALESQGALEKAKAAYQDVIERYTGDDVVLKGWAEARKRQIEQENARKFYAQLERYEPPKPSLELPEKLRESPTSSESMEKPSSAPILPPTGGADSTPSGAPTTEGEKTTKPKPSIEVGETVEVILPPKSAVKDKSSGQASRKPAEPADHRPVGADKNSKRPTKGE